MGRDIMGGAITPVILYDSNGEPTSSANPIPVTTSVDPSIEIKRAIISAATSGNNTLVAGVASKKIALLGCVLIVSGDVDVRFESAANGAALSGVMSLAVDGNGFVLPISDIGKPWLKTVAGELLNLELSASVQVSGFLVYYEE